MARIIILPRFFAVGEVWQLIFWCEGLEWTTAGIYYLPPVVIPLIWAPPHAQKYPLVSTRLGHSTDQPICP